MKPEAVGVAVDIAPDITCRLELDFPLETFARLEQLRELSPISERVLRCIVFAARGHPQYFDYLCQLAKSDFRDVIVAAEYAPNGSQLYNFNKPISLARIDLRPSDDSGLPFDPAHLDGRTLVMIQHHVWGYQRIESGRLNYDGSLMLLCEHDLVGRPITPDELASIRPVLPTSRIPQCRGYDFYLVASD